MHFLVCFVFLKVSERNFCLSYDCVSNAVAFATCARLCARHHRGMHGPGVNHSDRMRLAVLHEWVRHDINDGPPPSDMWRDWSEEVRMCPEHSGVGAHYVDAKL